MFHVLVRHPIDEYWEERDVQLRDVVGRRWDYSWADSYHRYLSWLVIGFKEAKLLQSVLTGFADVVVTIREQ